MPNRLASARVANDRENHIGNGSEASKFLLFALLTLKAHLWFYAFMLNTYRGMSPYLEQISVSSPNPMSIAQDKIAFDSARIAFDKANHDLQRLKNDPETSLARLSKAQRDYDLSRVQWLRCQWQLRANAAHALKTPPRTGPIAIVGQNQAVRESLAVLLGVKGYGRPKALGFDCWQRVWLDTSLKLVLLDVPEHSVTTSLWFVDGFEDAVEKPHIIALVKSRHAGSFAGKIDAVVAKPFALDELLQAIDAIDEKTNAGESIAINRAINGAINGAINSAISSAIHGVIHGVIHDVIHGAITRANNGAISGEQVAAFPSIAVHRHRGTRSRPAAG
ncbi:hypothetical protein [Paraburkholderia tagetis]|uniref:Uncharacterized protein n=1 Tax=Paraburkholderia tagetis TaxID=2913261 RepID=A0A9X1RUG0_9BURK|nr:hypothetical protein [Paraburkholderia tagetis]MCG5076067.1 hypothetical protein [Paraburkholderia tagetis]